MSTKLEFISSLVLGSLFFSACASAPLKKSAPAWLTQPTRTVDNGYIIYVSKAEDPNLERALFKAESIAIQDVANECSFAPKGTRIEDTFEQAEGAMHKMYLKMGVSFEDCEAAKKSLDPEAIRKLANVTLTEELARYQDLYETDVMPEVVVADNKNTVAPVLGGTGQFQGDPMQYYITRQQLAYQKEVVIISPSNTYVVNSPQSQAFVASISGPTRNIQIYERQTPMLRTSPQAWSSLNGRPSLRRPASLGSYSRGLRQSSSFRGNSSPHQGRRGGGIGGGRGRRYRGR